MQPFSKIHGVPAAALPEATLTLDNVGLDYSLVRLEAPAEYRELGAALSVKRRKAAEYGSTHETARKLGAIFQDILPSTPSLFRAYGLRASNIAQSLSIDTRDGKDYGPFAEYVGVDGTSIWAAATSGKGAVAIHLLACMLARLWKASEAIAIWEEILEERKKELSTWDESDVMPLRLFTIGRISVTREHLAEWDASARAWLRAADTAKEYNQTQLRIIVEDLNVPVSRDSKVYTSVMLAWKTAMSTIDKLIQGISQSVSSGAVLLGLLAWHLYPDLIVLGSIPRLARQNDPLIAPGGSVTLGLQENELETSRGVYWSLSLAHVRYYGDPVTFERSLDSTQSRISIEDLWQIALASLVTAWGETPANTLRAVELVHMVWQMCKDALTAVEWFKWRDEIQSESWLRHLGDAAQRYLHSTEHERSSCRRLFGLGQRRSTLLGKSTQPVPIFGLSDKLLVQIMKIKERKQYLRRIASEYSKEGDVLVIKTCLDRDGEISRYHMTTVFAQTPFLPSSHHSSNKPCHKNWFLNSQASPRAVNPLPNPETIDDEQQFSSNPGWITLFKDGKWFEWARPPPEYAEYTRKPSEDVTLKGRRFFSKLRRKIFDSSEDLKATATFEYVFGDVHSAALFRRRNLEGVRFRKLDRTELEHEAKITIEQITDVFVSNIVDPDLFLKYMLFDGGVSTPEGNQNMSLVDVYDALRAIAITSKTYSHMPNATVSLSIVTFEWLIKARWFQQNRRELQIRSEKKHLDTRQPSTMLEAEAPWLRQNRRESKIRSEKKNLDTGTMLLPYNLSRPATFSCIAMFESGNIDLDPIALNTVMALSSGDSIFVAAPILCDPARRSELHKVRKIFGNIGRGGIAFLTPPTNPRSRKFDLESYHVINHEPYDGKLENCFQSTTLHLGFSGYEFALDVGDHGGRFKEAFFMESLIKVHDRGEWIADLDALNALDDPKLYISDEIPECKCDHSSLDSRSSTSDRGLIAIDRWEELLERPRTAAVVRAHRNWMARLAAVTLSIKMGNRTVVSAVDGNVRCHKCSEEPDNVTNAIYII